MALEKLLEELIAAVKENTAALKGGVIASPAKEAAPEKAERAERAPRAAKEKDEPRRSRGKGVSEKEFTEKVQDFLDVPDDPDEDDEYEARLKKVIDPILDEAKVKSFRELPEDLWPKMVGAIDDYLEKSKEKDEPRRSRRER